MAAIRLIGRDDAIAPIEQRLRGIGQRGGALLIRGSAGIGKSALLELAVEDAQSRGYRVLTTTGVESETKLPFAGLHQLLHPSIGRISSLPGPQRDALLTAFGMLAGEAPSLFLVGLAALSLITDVASDAPLVVVADDAQWLDAPTAEVLAFLARRLGADPVLLLATLRDDFETPLLRAQLDEVQLEPLDEATSMQLLDAHAPELGSSIRARVLQEASGNPLALVELPRALRSKPHVDAQLLPLTDRLQRAFALRGSDLPARTRMALLAAAADDSADLLEVLAATTSMTRSAVTTDVFEPAVEAGLVSLLDTRLEFRHPLVRSAMYQSAALSERHAVHGALAEVLINNPDRRAWHRAAATLGTDSEAAADLEAAARRAQQRGALAVAALGFERAAALTNDARARIHYLLVAAEIGFELGQPALVGRLLDEVERHVVDDRERARMIWLREIFNDGTPGDAAAIRRLVDSERVREGVRTGS